MAIPPLNVNLARQLMQKTKVYTALQGVRGRRSIDMAELENILIRFSCLIVENPGIKECDINPLLASEDGIIALDARIVLHDSEIPDDQLPKLAIRPYPYNYVENIHLKNGASIILRPIRPEDESLISAFHRELSESSVRNRYFEFITLDERVAHDRLVRICFNDYDREWAIVAEAALDNSPFIAGIGRLTKVPDTSIAQLKLTIVDAFHHLGLGTQLLGHLLKIAKEEGIQTIDAVILSENEGMLKIVSWWG